MDVHDKKTRSKNMRAIKSKDTQPEIILRKAIHKKGLRYRICPKDVPGNRTFIFRNTMPRYLSTAASGMFIRVNTLGFRQPGLSSGAKS
ncbi:hypothetical protein P4S64_01865 [Vibrio sp. M60_M31a]